MDALKSTSLDGLQSIKNEVDFVTKLADKQHNIVSNV